MKFYLKKTHNIQNQNYRDLENSNEEIEDVTTQKIHILNGFFRLYVKSEPYEQGVSQIYPHS